jgi:putative ABC transport system permease protein
MLLKILGAGQGQLRIILMSEQVFLAVLSVGSGYLLAEVLCRVLIPNLMESAVVVPYGLVMPLLVIAVMLNIVMSGLLSREIFRAKPLELIRSV